MVAFNDNFSRLKLNSIRLDYYATYKASLRDLTDMETVTMAHRSISNDAYDYISSMLERLSQNTFRPRLHGNGSMWNRTRTVRIGLTFTRELMEPFHTELLAVLELVHLESRSHREPNQKVLV